MGAFLIPESKEVWQKSHPIVFVGIIRVCIPSRRWGHVTEGESGLRHLRNAKNTDKCGPLVLISAIWHGHAGKKVLIDVCVPVEDGVVMWQED